MRLYQRMALQVCEYPMRISLLKGIKGVVPEENNEQRAKIPLWVYPFNVAVV
jgi:hypothetical protein